MPTIKKDTNKQRVLAISKRLKLSHIGSNLSCLPILEEIYAKKRSEDKVILDNAHAHIAHLVAQGYSSDIAVYMLEAYGIHCDTAQQCDASGGSLGHGIGISIGYAFANPKSKVYCIVSDGSMMEGSNWEALRLIDSFNIKNIELHLNANGYSAVAKVDIKKLKRRMRQFTQVRVHRTYNGMRELEGLKGHYAVL